MLASEIYSGCIMEKLIFPYLREPKTKARIFFLSYNQKRILSISVQKCLAAQQNMSGDILSNPPNRTLNISFQN